MAVKRGTLITDSRIRADDRNRVKISQAIAEVKPCEARFGESILHFEYRPLTYTVAEMEKMQEGTPKAGAIVDSMLKLVVSWDLTDDDEVVVPLEAATLREIPSHIFTGIMQAVGKDQTPSGEASAPSDAS